MGDLQQSMNETFSLSRYNQEARLMYCPKTLIFLLEI